MRHLKFLTLFSVCILFAVGCASQGKGHRTNKQVFDERCKVVPDGTIVMRDRSSTTSVAAAAVTASGALKPLAVVGPGIATSRGGAIATHDVDTDVEMVECVSGKPRKRITQSCRKEWRRFRTKQLDHKICLANKEDAQKDGRPIFDECVEPKQSDELKNCSK